MNPVALAQVIIALLPTVTSGVEHLIAFVESVRTVAKTTGEWTDDMQAKYRQSLVACGKDPAWQPDPS